MAVGQRRVARRAAGVLEGHRGARAPHRETRPHRRRGDRRRGGGLRWHHARRPVRGGGGAPRVAGEEALHAPRPTPSLHGAAARRDCRRDRRGRAGWSCGGRSPGPVPRSGASGDWGLGRETGGRRRAAAAAAGVRAPTRRPTIWSSRRASCASARKCTWSRRHRVRSARRSSSPPCFSSIQATCRALPSARSVRSCRHSRSRAQSSAVSSTRTNSAVSVAIRLRVPPSTPRSDGPARRWPPGVPPVAPRWRSCCGPPRARGYGRAAGSLGPRKGPDAGRSGSPCPPLYLIRCGAS